MRVDLREREANVFDLSIEEPRAHRLQFDPRRDLPDLMWQNLAPVKELPFDRKSSLARDLKIVAPERFEEFGIKEPNLTIFDADAVASEKDLQETVAKYNIAFPGLIERKFPGIEFALRLPSSWNETKYVESLWLLIGLYGAGQPTDLTDLSNIRWFLKPKLTVERTAKLAALNRLLFPKNFKVDNVITDDFWLEAKETFSTAHFQQDKDAAHAVYDMHLARDLTILAAHNAEITKDGLVIVLDSPQVNSGEPTLPMERSF